MKKRYLISVLALLLAAVMLFAACGDEGTTSKDNSSTESTGSSVDSSSKDDVSSEDSSSDSNKEDDKKEEENKEDNKNSGTSTQTGNVILNRKPVRVENKYDPIDDGSTSASNSYTYDLKVTTFNVGGFYHGVDNGMHENPGAPYEQWVGGNLTQWLADIPRLDADVVGFQEFCPLFYENKTQGVNIASKDAFAKVFKTLETFEGVTNNGIQPMYMALGGNSNSPYKLTDISYGHLTDKDEASQRAYMKGYITVKGVKIAVYSVHLGFNDKTAVKDSWNEIVSLMNKEDYCIVMGDMNSNDIAAFMESKGFNVANMGKFGNFGTYEYDEEKYIDNIFTTANIKIQYAECEKALSGGSDHYPLSAYLKIDTKMGSTKVENPYKTDSDGFIDGWYKP